MKDIYMNIIIAGPCGVGKSTIASLLAQRTGMKYLDFDEIRAAKKEGPPCSISKINIMECFSQELSDASTRFILDIGGGTVFRPTTNNDEQLRQILGLKEAFSAQVIILRANKDNLFERYTISTKKKGIVRAERNSDYFNLAWANWRKFEQPNWKKCSDATIDTTFLTANDVVEQILLLLRNSGV